MYIFPKGHYSYADCEPGAVVRVRVRGNVVRIRIDETAIRIRIVVRAANDTAPEGCSTFVRWERTGKRISLSGFDSIHFLDWFYYSPGC